MSFLADIAKLAIEQSIAASPVTVDYQQIATGFHVGSFVAAFGAMRIDAKGLDGHAVRIPPSDARDIVCFPADLAIVELSFNQLTGQLQANTIPVEPESGDLVTLTLPNETQLNFEVLPFEPDPAWRWTDRFETGRRIHLKRKYD